MTDGNFDTEATFQTLLDESARGSQAFEVNMVEAGASLAELSFGEVEKPLSLAIVTPACDRDFVAGGFLDYLRDHKSQATATTSTLWHKYSAATDFVRAMTMLMAQHHEDHPDHVDQILYICSSIAEDATIADSLSRFSKIVGARERVICTLSASKAEVETLNLQFKLRDMVIPRMTVLEGKPSFNGPNKAAKVRKSLRSHLKLAYKRRGLAYIPVALGGPGPEYTTVYEPPAFGI